MNPARSSKQQFRRQVADFAALVSGGKTILLSSHKSPDGDAVASLLAAARIVELLGSRAVPVLDGVIPDRYAFLPGALQVQNVQNLPADSHDALVVVDCGSLARLGALAENISSDLLLVNIDHHPDNTLFGKLNLVYPEASSTTELLYDILTALELPLELLLATILYTGLMTDTGSFRYANTSARCFAVAERLIRIGVDPAAVSQAVYGVNTLNAVKLLGQALTSLELTAGGLVAVMTVPQPEDYQELEDFTDFALTIKGVRTVVLFRVGKGIIRVSLRARGPYDVAQVARRYGGGGHLKAAGFTWQGALEEIRARVLDDLRDEVEDAGAESPHPAG